MHSEPRLGRTPSGKTFSLPATPDMFQALLNPRRSGPTEQLALLLILLTLLPLPLPVPAPLYLVVFCFWRVSYNVLLALLLHHQSSAQAITTWISTRSPSAQSLLNYLSTATLPTSYRWEHSPPELNAWLVFRALSTIILANDGVSYFAFVCKYNVPFSDSHPMVLLFCIPTGVALLFFSFWAKARAHDVLGDFAWFWGDFFFTVDGELVFDGVFRLFPHPMYTVGYAGYYGAALMSRSYTVLLVSLVAHASQLLFLAIVEEPHIRKIYGTNEKDAPAESHGLQNNHSGLSPHAQFLATVPSAPVFVVIGAALATFIFLGGMDRGATYLIVLITVGWRVVHWGGCAVLLRASDKKQDNLWMRLFGSELKTRAFSSWQHAYLGSYLLNHALFLVAALRISGDSCGSWIKFWSHFLGGLTLVGIAAVAMSSAWTEVGWFGFYYGDFFVVPKNGELVHGGSYRYVSHPELWLGYLAYHGLAIMKQSWGLFWLGVFCQVTHWFFTSFVEKANIMHKYKLVSERTALEDFVEGLPVLKTLTVCMRTAGLQSAELAHKAYGTHLEDIPKKLTVCKEKLQADLSKAGSQMWTDQVVGRASDLMDKAEATIGVLDCDRVVSLLESKGLQVRKVS